MSDINEVRERLADRADGFDAFCDNGMASDIRALLADHARLQEVVAKIGNDAPTLCDLCRVRERLSRDDDGISFCKGCMEVWRGSWKPINDEVKK